MDFFSNYKDVSNTENTIITDNVNTDDNNDNNNNKVIDVITNVNTDDNNDNVNTDDNNDNNNEVIDVIYNVNTDDTNDTDDTDDTDDTNDDNKVKEIIDVNTDDNHTTGLIYDILHIFDDIYVYGRTFIENNYINLSENDEFNLVYPNIYIGNYSTSTNYNLLKKLGITHIVSVMPAFNPPFLDQFKYLHIQAYDDESQDIKQYFEISNEFISKCLNEGGKVLIHCMVGRSRSVSICMAFLIHIIQGYFHKKSLNLENYNDEIYNLVEYNKFIKKNKQNYNTNNNTNTNTNNNYENINRFEHIKPLLNNKEKSYIIYKKEVMLNEIDELINTYNILKNNISIKNTCDNDENIKYKTVDDLNKIIKNMKEQAGAKFITQLLKYIKKYRTYAKPNPFFIKQLIEILF